MQRDRIKLTPGFFSIAFGVFLLVLSGVSGFYIPKGSSETIDLARAAMTVIPTEATAPLPAPQESPAAIQTGAGDRNTPTIAATRTPIANATPSPKATSSPTPAATPAATATSAPSKLIHVVKSGETLLEIAERYGVSLDALLEANGLRDPDKLAIGDELIIPRLRSN